jgi:hypothetical protein
MGKKKIWIIASLVLVVLAIITLTFWMFASTEEQGDFEKERRSAMISYLSNPSFTNSDFSAQLTKTKAKLEINQLDERKLYFSIKKTEFDEKNTIKRLCLDPKKVEFASLNNDRLILGDYSFRDTACLFFRFPDSLFRIQNKLKFKIDYDQYSYTVTDEELTDFLFNRTVYGGEYYLTRNGGDQEIAYGMNHGVMVAKKNEPSLQRFVKKLTSHCETQEEKIQALLNFVTTRIKYSFNEAYSGRETLKRPNEVLMTGTSDCSGKTILFASFLEQIGADYRIAYMEKHITVFVKGNFKATNGFILNVDNETYYLAETTCPDFIIGESALTEGTLFSFVRYIQKVGSPSIVTNCVTKKKFEL